MSSYLVSIVNVNGNLEFGRERHLLDGDLITKRSQGCLVLGQCIYCMNHGWQVYCPHI